MKKVHSYLYSFIPFGFLIIINILLIRVIQRKTLNLQESTSLAKKNQLSINVSVIVMTILFIVFTCPSAICSQFYNTLIQTQSGKITLFSLGCFAFSYHALNIVILCASNKFFYRKLKEAIASVNKVKDESISKSDITKVNSTTENRFINNR